METWTWLVAYVVGFGFVQLLLYRHFRRDDPSPDAAPPPDRSARRSLERASPRAVAEGVHCQRCGAFNRREPTFTYCKACLEPLG